MKLRQSLRARLRLRLRLSGAKHSFSGFGMLKKQREGFNMDKFCENIFWETIDNLKEKGASSIVILPVEKLVS